MKTLKIILVVTIAVIALLAVVFLLIGYFKPQPAGLRVIATPISDVYINDSFIGKTPYKGTMEPGEITLKIVPSGNDLVIFETKIPLVDGVETIVRREFGKTDEETSGDILSFKKTSSKTTSLVVSSAPDNAQVLIDGVVKGFTPYKLLNTSPGEHNIVIKSSDMKDRSLTVNTLKNYQLTIYAKLASKKMEDTPSSTPLPTKTVEILDTPTGFLRVRTEPGTKGEEIAEVKPGQKFTYLETDVNSGWFKIQYQEPKAGLPNGIVGWVSNQYSKILNSSGDAGI